MLKLLSNRGFRRSKSAYDLVSTRGFPVFDSPEGARLRKKLGAATDKTPTAQLVPLAEKTWDTKWLPWLDADMCRAYPRDTELLSRWICHEIAFGNAGTVRALKVVLLSLPHDPNAPSILNTKARLGYFEGELDAGDAAFSSLRENHPEYDVKWVIAERVNTLIRLKKWDELDEALGELLKAHSGDASIFAMAVRAFAEAGQNSKIVSLVEDHGGPDAIEQEYSAYLYLTALESNGQKARCLGEGISILDRHPDFFSLYFMLRSVAHSLDAAQRLEPVFETAAQLFPNDPRVIEIQCLAALDQDNFDLVEELLGRFADKKSESYLRFNLTYCTTRPGQTGAQEAYEAYRATGVNHVGPEVQFAGYLLGTAKDLYDLVRAHDVLEPRKEAGARNIGFAKMFIQLLVAMGRADEAESYFDALAPHIKEAQVLRELAAFFEQRRGNHAQATKTWASLATSGAYRSVTNASDLPERVTFNYDDESDQVLAFACVYNAIEFGEWFLDYYRKLGVDHFFVVDNGSNDGTSELFSAQEDVSLFSQPGSFKDSAHGVYWINHLMRTYAQGKWSFFVDMDEAFVFPGMDEGRTLADLLGYCDANGYGAMPSFMLDVFPETESASFDAPSAFDNDYFSFDSTRAPYRIVQGGFRSRLTNRNFLITKSPLVKVTPDFYYLENNHTHTHLPVADIETTLVHYKFIGDAQQRFAEAVERQQHFMGARFYKDLNRSLKGGLYERAETSLTYEGAAQLEKLELIKGSDAWRAFEPSSKR